MHVYVFAHIYLITSELILREVIASISTIDKGIFPLEKGSIGIQFFIDIENEDHSSPCNVNSWSKMCCLDDQNSKDCTIDAINCNYADIVLPQTRETLVFLYPTLYPYDQIGYCDFVVDFRCGHNFRYRKFDARIPFDTKLANKKKTRSLKAYTDLINVNCQSLDEDSLNACEPVNCDLKYSGRKPFFEGISSKCVMAPICETDVSKTLPDIVYVPKSNVCRDLDRTISIGDLYAIDTGIGIVTESTKSYNDMDDYKVILTSNCTTVSENVKLLGDMMFGKLCPIFNGDISAYKSCCAKAVLSICGCIIATCGLLLSIFCFIHTMMWCSGKWSKGELKNIAKNIKKRFNAKELAKRSNYTKINRDLTNNLLREVIVRDLPIEMRDSVVDICQRIEHEIKEKKRYRMTDIGSQVNLRGHESSSSSETSSHTSVPDHYDNSRLVH